MLLLPFIKYLVKIAQLVIKDKKNDNLKFSNVALNELKQMCDNVEEMYSIAIDILSNGKFEELDRLSKLEEMTDEYKEKFSAKHFERLSQEN